MEDPKGTSMNGRVQKARSKTEVFREVHTLMESGLKWWLAEKPRNWLKGRGISPERTGAVFNSGQLHAGKPQVFKDDLMSIGFLKDEGKKTSMGHKWHFCFGRYGVLFPLKDRDGNVVNFYAIRINLPVEEHSILNREGIYPGFPHEMTSRLFIATSVMDAATLLESRTLQNRDSLICIPDGKVLSQHEEAIKGLSSVKVIIWIARENENKEAMKRNIDHLREIVQNVPIKTVVLPDGENLNQVFLRRGSAGIQTLLDGATFLEEVTEVESIPLPIPMQETLPEEEVVILPLPESEETLPMEEPIKEKQEIVPPEPEPVVSPKEIQKPEKEKAKPLEESPDETDYDPAILKLEILHEHKLLMRTPLNNYYVLGTITQDLGSMRVTLMVEELASGRKERTKLDLYEREQISLYSQQIGDLYNQPSEQIEADLVSLTDLLEKCREVQMEETKTKYQTPKKQSALSAEKRSACIQFLSGKNFMKGIDELIEQAGVVGEESTRRLLFVIASTYKMNTPLHALVQGTSGSGKSHLINTIGDCFPPEDVISMTRVTSKSFYHYTKDELVDKLILIQDYDGLDEEAQFAFRELQSAGNISSSTTYKDRYGNLMSAVKTVRSHFASLLATTKAEVYYDNMSRSMVTGVDESDEQTKRIIVHQNKNLAGIIDSREERKAKEFLQNCMRCIRQMEVVNPYADKIYLPFEAKMLRRLNSHYQAFVKQITILHQYQRKKDERGRLIAEPEDLHIACEIMFDAIMLKVDDLDSSLRQFFDRMKEHIRKISGGTAKPHEFQFTQRDVRLFLNISKTQCFRYFEELELSEYIQRTGGYANRGFKYKIVFWDDIEKTRERIKGDLKKQLATIGSNEMEHQNPDKQGE